MGNHRETQPLRASSNALRSSIPPTMNDYLRRDTLPPGTCPSGLGLSYYNCSGSWGGFIGCCTADPCNPAGCPDLKSATGSVFTLHREYMISPLEYANETKSIAATTKKSTTKTKATNSPTSRHIEPTTTSRKISAATTSAKPSQITATSSPSPDTTLRVSVTAFVTATDSAPSASSTASSAARSQSAQQSSKKPAVGGIIGSIFAALLILAIIAFLLWRRRRQRKDVHEITSPAARRRFEKSGIFNATLQRAMTPAMGRNSNLRSSSDKPPRRSPTAMAQPTLPRPATPPPATFGYTEKFRSPESYVVPIPHRGPQKPVNGAIRETPHQRPSQHAVLSNTYSPRWRNSVAGPYAAMLPPPSFTPANMPPRTSRSSSFVLPNTSYRPPVAGTALSGGTSHVLSWVDADGSRTESPLRFTKGKTPDSMYKPVMRNMI
jgi:hypothetical protein